MVSKLLSPFELLLNKPQLPDSLLAATPALRPIGRELIQGYFLTISNTVGQNLTLGLDFIVDSRDGGTPFTLPGSNTPTQPTGAVFYDVRGVNEVLGLIDPSLAVESVPPGNVPPPEVTTRLTLKINAFETGLLIVQPNPSLLLQRGGVVEIRGYVNVFLASPVPMGLTSAKFLFNAEHRGTFYNLDALRLGDQTRVQPDQIAYPIPISSTNGSLLTVEPL